MLEQFGLEVWQLILLGIAAAVMVTMFFDRKKTVTTTTPTTPVPMPDPILPIIPDSHSVQVTIPHAEPNKDVIRIVCCWSSFKRECVKAGLTDAVIKIDEIFPMLIDLNGGSHAEQ